MQTENEERRTEPKPSDTEVTFDETWRTTNDDPDATWPTIRRSTREEPL